jgi:hypothetical protein
MEGYEVITSEDSKAGRVVEVQGDNLIVEHGTIFKSRHALPRTFVEVDDGDRVVRASISKQILESSPKIDDGDVDARAKRGQKQGAVVGDSRALRRQRRKVSDLHGIERSRSIVASQETCSARRLPCRPQVRASSGCSTR